MSTIYLAFPSSDELHALSDGFIERMKAGARKTEPETIERIMQIFIGEALQVFMLTPANQSGLSNTMSKVVNLTADTIQKAAHTVMKSTVKKLSLEQNQKVAEYMDSIRQQFMTDGEMVWHIAVPLNDQQAQSNLNALNMAIENPGDAARKQYGIFLAEITDFINRSYFEEPVHLLNFGPVLRKIAMMGIATSRKASHSAIKRIVPSLDNEKLSLSASYFKALHRQD